MTITAVYTPSLRGDDSGGGKAEHSGGKHGAWWRATVEGKRSAVEGSGGGKAKRGGRAIIETRKRTVVRKHTRTLNNEPIEE
ncbi:hypothetical protein PHAVU_009G126900 [Phaseolus vulgaris]|uniref:Uncharacterized protein n=1 Tax=Phaseolus vulgaris TaxID=3885 RepID=V7AVU1_PHAVU|nr:hypothetical protein PHAVU_009G126900g [Phaseolus vulgaris]ESW09430.1 hypothetical protein PHAVU_009G126900g [Phaseolus vulgaris]